MKCHSRTLNSTLKFWFILIVTQGWWLPYLIPRHYADFIVQINHMCSHTPATALVGLLDQTLKLIFTIFMSLEKSLNWVLIQQIIVLSTQHVLYQSKHCLDILGNTKLFTVNDFPKRVSGMTNDISQLMWQLQIVVTYTNVVFQRWKQSSFKHDIASHSLYKTEAGLQTRTLHYWDCEYSSL